jgi:predicted RNase H-like HicB family nuclease
MATAHVTYHYEPEGWWVESAEYPGYTAFAASRDEATALAREGLPFFARDEDLIVLGLDDPKPVSGVDVLVPVEERPLFHFHGLTSRRLEPFGTQTEGEPALQG